MAELQLLVDGVVVKSFPLEKGKMMIGRSRRNDIVIDEDAVSGEHACIEVVPNKYIDGAFDTFIEDLGSTNGTYVNDARVKRQQLHNSDLVRIAWTNFKLVYGLDEDLEQTSVIAQ